MTQDTATQGWAVVLGASAGSGAAIAEALARDPGLNVFGAHRGNHPASAQAVQRAVTARGRRYADHVGDASTPEGADTGADALLAAAGPRSVRFFVHSLASASVGRLAGDAPLSPRQITRTFDVMAHSFVTWTQAMLARDLLAPGARLLGLTNPLDESLILDCGLIAATKGALHAYVRALALELGPRGVRVNLLKFPTVITPAVARVYGPETLDALVTAHEQLMPSGRMCTVEEVGAFVSLLAHPAAEPLNGAVVDFSGGMSLGLADRVLRG